MNLFSVIGIALAVVVLYVVTCIRILYEYERGVIFRLGRVLPETKGPGFIMVFWPVDRLVRVSLRIIVQDVPAQDVITRDNVSVKVNAVVYFRVVEPMKAILEVEDYQYATFQLSQTTLRSIIGQVELDDLLAERDRVNKRIQTVIDQQTDPWGIKVRLVEVKHVDLPEHMQRVMAKQAESERERRAKIIHAEGEFGAAERLRDAALVIEGHPMAMQMRFLQTLTEVGAEQNSTIVFPFPLDLIAPLFTNGSRGSDDGRRRTDDGGRGTGDGGRGTGDGGRGTGSRGRDVAGGDPPPDS
jgi:regulator of protease activity HflC (stomatin/prohibitin superfamily)